MASCVQVTVAKASGNSAATNVRVFERVNAWNTRDHVHASCVRVCLLATDAFVAHFDVWSAQLPCRLHGNCSYDFQMSYVQMDVGGLTQEILPGVLCPWWRGPGTVLAEFVAENFKKITLKLLFC